ncbi:MAG: hypothetical protein IT372_30930 [Polyangiaceae bacterium]|nr:hypothetical protein [Polyangiaceae bacterium]
MQESTPSNAGPVHTDQLDPGMKYTLTAKTSTGDITLGSIVVITNEGTLTDYYTLSAALPAGATSITIAATTQSTPPTTYTFAVAAAAFTSVTPPSSSSTLFVDTASNVGLVWGFTLSGGTWSGSATWYHDTSSRIEIGAGKSIVLANNTYDSDLDWRAVNTAP